MRAANFYSKTRQKLLTLTSAREEELARRKEEDHEYFKARAYAARRYRESLERRRNIIRAVSMKNSRSSELIQPASYQWAFLSGPIEIEKLTESTVHFSIQGKPFSYPAVDFSLDDRQVAGLARREITQMRERLREAELRKKIAQLQAERSQLQKELNSSARALEALRKRQELLQTQLTLGEIS